jgi:YggT family protein
MNDVLVNFVTLLATVLTLLILARVLISWVNPSGGGELVAFVYHATEPFLAPIRNLLPRTGGFDFSPMIAILILQTIARVFATAFS